jgi:hypothetical protein
MEGAWSAAERIGGTMHRDPAQPCDEVLVRRNLIERPVQFKEHVLRYFFGGSAVAEHTVRDAEDPRLMRLDNLPKLAGDPWHCASNLRSYSHIRKKAPGGMQFVSFIFAAGKTGNRREGMALKGRPNQPPSFAPHRGYSGSGYFVQISKLVQISDKLQLAGSKYTWPDI